MLGWLRERVATERASSGEVIERGSRSESGDDAMVARDEVKDANGRAITSAVQRIGVLRRMPDRAKRGKAVVRSNAQLASIG